METCENMMPEKEMTEKEFSDTKERMERYWQPESGTYRIRLLSEMGSYRVFDRQTHSEIIKFGILVELEGAKKPKIFILGAGTTFNSLLGQFIKLKTEHKTLNGKELEVRVKMTGAFENQKRTYTINLINTPQKTITKSGKLGFDQPI